MRSFAGRWVVLWREDAGDAGGDAAAGTEATGVGDTWLLFYESPDSAEPIDVACLPKGRFSVAPPKTLRKGETHCFRVNVEPEAKGTGKRTAEEDAGLSSTTTILG